MPPPSPRPPRLLDRVRHAIRTRHYSRRTEEAYVYWIREFILFQQKRHPDTMGALEISAYLTWLAVQRQVSASTQNQALSALLFLYREVLRRGPGDIPPVVRARTPERLPVVLGRGEVRRVLQQLDGSMRVVGLLLYGAGLRLQECLELRGKDIDFERRHITVRQGKGRKDRVTPLPEAAVEGLTQHLESVRERHRADLADGYGRVQLPFALERKYPGAATEWRWQFVFPAGRICRDPDTKPPAGTISTSLRSSGRWPRRCVAPACPSG